MKKAFYLILFVAACMLLCGLQSCRTIQTIVETRTEFVHDTLQTRDSVYISRTQYMKGDTIFVHDTLETFKFRDKVIEKCRVDSIPYPVEVVKNVRVRNGYDKFTSCGFWVLLAIVLLVVCVRIYVRTRLRK